MPNLHFTKQEIQRNLISSCGKLYKYTYNAYTICGEEKNLSCNVYIYVLINNNNIKKPCRVESNNCFSYIIWI